MRHKEIDLDHALNADLHSHSTQSDGTLTPEVLAQRAKNRGVELWALTDHDEIAGVGAAAKAAAALNLPFLTGVEISINFSKEVIHIVALGFDLNNEPLAQGLRKIRQGRYERGEKIAAALEKVGVKGALQGALQFASNPEALSRTHFSRFLVDQGFCQNNNEVFKKYLGKGQPGYVEHEWVGLEECLEWIHNANGMAVIAHPGRYRGLSKNQHGALFSQFIALGGQGVEVVTGSHSPEEAIKYTEVAQEYKLLASRGSDFHSPEESRIDLGGLPDLNRALDPVWVHLADRIIYE